MQKKIDDMQKYTYEFLKDKTISSDLFSLSNILTASFRFLVVVA